MSLSSGQIALFVFYQKYKTVIIMLLTFDFPGDVPQYTQQRNRIDKKFPGESIVLPGIYLFTQRPWFCPAMLSS